MGVAQLPRPIFGAYVSLHVYRPMVLSQSLFPWGDYDVYIGRNWVWDKHWAKRIAARQYLPFRSVIDIYIYTYIIFYDKKNKLLSLPPSSTPLMKPCRNGLDGIRTLNQLILIDRLFFLDEGWRFSWLAPCPKQAGHLPMPTCMTCFCLFKSVLILPILHLFGVCLYPPFWSGILLVSVTGVVRNWCLVW